MANVVLTPTAVTREFLRVLHQKLNFIGSINRQYDDSFAKEGAKIGSSLKIRQPNQYTVTTGAVLTAQDTTETSITLNVSTQKHVGMNFSSNELTLSLDEFSKRIINPAASVLAANVESDALSMYKDVYNQVNNVGAAITFKKIMDARKKLVDNLTPMDEDWTALLNTQDNIDMVDALKGLFHDAAAVKEQYREGTMGRTGGFNFAENTLMPSHARGAADTAYTTDTRTSALPITLPNTPVTEIAVLSGADALADGEIFTIGNVFRVHPETKVSTGNLQQFVCTAAYTGGGGNISISPSIITAGALQNVTIPTTSATAAIVIAGTISTNYGISMAYHKDAFTFVTADLVMPTGVDFSARKAIDGISLRVVRQYDINNDKFPCRVDILYGYRVLREQMACRLANN